MPDALPTVEAVQPSRGLGKTTPDSYRDHLELLERQRVLWVLDVPDHLEYLLRIDGIS